MLYQDVFLTRIKSLEILSLLNNIKPVVRQGFYDDELARVKRFCRDNNLFLVESEFKVLPFETGFSDKGQMVKKDNKDAMSFVYISKDELLANTAALFEIKQDHLNLGKILG